MTKDHRDPTRFYVHTRIPRVFDLVASSESEVNKWTSALVACMAYSEALQGAKAAWIGGEVCPTLLPLVYLFPSLLPLCPLHTFHIC